MHVVIFNFWYYEMIKATASASAFVLAIEEHALRVQFLRSFDSRQKWSWSAGLKRLPFDVVVKTSAIK